MGSNATSALSAATSREAPIASGEFAVMISRLATSREINLQLSKYLRSNGQPVLFAHALVSD
jgi:hypothetical protein